jgi:very-short-patch-repair endonuclease
MKLFKNIDPKGLKTRLEGRLRAIDIFIPKLNLCIEFDGSYWHKDKRDIDKIKSEMLFEEGFKLIRVREEPLKKIYDTDVISKQPYNGKQVTNDILSVVLEMYELDDKIVSKINKYQSKDKLQNEKGLERYIDKILTEKAERKSSKTKTAK